MMRPIDKQSHDAKTLKEIKAAIKNGAEINSKDKFGNTPLHIAAYRGDVKTCELLIKL